MYCLWVHTLRGCAEVCLLGALWAPLQGRTTATYLWAHRRHSGEAGAWASWGCLRPLTWSGGCFHFTKPPRWFLVDQKTDMCQQDVHGRATRRSEPNWPVALQRGRQSVRLTGHIPGAGGGGTARWEVNICWVPGTAAKSLELLPSSSELQAPWEHAEKSYCTWSQSTHMAIYLRASPGVREMDIFLHT